MISVVVPLYNKEKSILATIDSVLAQSYSNFELLVINDGSTDKSRDVLSVISDPRLRIIDKANGGVSSARNRGISEARAEYIAFLDGDDLWDGDFLLTVRNLICEYPDASAYATGFSIKRNNSILSNYPLKERGVISNYFKHAMKGAIIHSSAICIKKEVFKSLQLFNEKLKRGEDLDMWSRIASKYKIAVDPTVRSYYSMDSENRASFTVPSLEESIVSVLNFENVVDPWQRIFYKSLIIRRIKEYASMKRSDLAIMVANFHKSNLGIDYYKYYIIAKLYSWL